MTVGDSVVTERLELVPWTDGELGFLERLSTDPAVVRYVSDGRTWTPVKAAAVCAAMAEHWRTHGFGWRVARRREDGRALGFIALNFSDAGTPGVAAGEYEIGWWLAREAWGHGYASEGARAVRAEALQRLGAPSLIARIQPGNRASRAVAEGLGMTVERETVGSAGEPVVVYRLTAGSVQI